VSSLSLVTYFRKYFGKKKKRKKVHSASINNRLGEGGGRKNGREIRIIERSGAFIQHKGKGAGFLIFPRADLSKDVLSMKGVIPDTEPHTYL